MINFEEAEKFENLKTKVLKYILYKKRSEQEIRTKFKDEDENILEDVIEYLKEAGYINDNNYVEKSVNEFMNLKNMSIKEISYKLYQKGVPKDIIDNYICENKEKMLEYEISSAQKIILKKSNLEENEIREFLYKKGYMKETVDIAILEEENK